jgi:hypothetical protein
MNYSYISRKIQLKYPSGRWITIRRHPTEHEIKKLKYSAYKMVDYSELTTHNELEIKIYNVSKEDFVTIISGGNWDFKENSPSGTVIDVKVKQADDELKKDINELIRDLCKTYLRPCICYPGVYSTRAKIDYFLHNEGEGNQFVNAFVKQIIQRVKTYDMGKKIEVNNSYPLTVNGEYVFPPEKSVVDETPNITEEKINDSDEARNNLDGCSFCQITSNEITECKYCKDLFCRDHLEPKSPQDIAYLITPGGHSCKPYAEQQEHTQSKEQNPDVKNPTNEKPPFWTRLFRK